MCIVGRSPFILEPLLTPQMKAHPAWRSWLCLVRLFGVTVQHSISVADIELVDDLQLQHSAAFDAVAEYAGLNPQAAQAPLLRAPRARHVALRPAAGLLVLWL